jgi:hypothetical protein
MPAQTTVSQVLGTLTIGGVSIGEVPEISGPRLRTNVTSYTPHGGDGYARLVAHGREWEPMTIKVVYTEASYKAALLLNINSLTIGATYSPPASSEVVLAHDGATLTFNGIVTDVGSPFNGEANQGMMFEMTIGVDGRITPTGFPA